jgi:hypothetical protein
MAKKHYAAVVFSVFLTLTGWAATPSPSLIATTSQPMWSDLTVQQKIILAPLSDDWDSMESFRQKKWLGIADRFSLMTAEEQRRVQGQMQQWGKLSSEQRQLARENFKTVNQLPAEKKQELKQKWEEYSNLPDEEKEKLKQQAASKPPAKPGLPLLVAPAPLRSVAPTIPIAPTSTLLSAPPAMTPDDTARSAVASKSVEVTTKP